LAWNLKVKNVVKQKKKKKGKRKKGKKGKTNLIETSFLLLGDGTLAYDKFNKQISSLELKIIVGGQGNHNLSKRFADLKVLSWRIRGDI